MSDLQCAASVIVAEANADDDAPGADGRDPAAALAASLTCRRVAMVYTSSAAPAVQVAEAVAATLGVPVRVLDDRPEPADGDGAAERLAAELESIADLHRGETVLVVALRGVTASVLRRLRVGPAGDGTTGPPPARTATVELSADADGWVCTSWTAALPR